MNNEIVNVSIDDILPNRFQPRLSFDEKELKNLSDSIKMHGIIQPLLLRRLGDKYEIIAGERRYKAAKMAGITKVPAIIKDLDDNQSAELAIIENIQRKNLSSLEEALSYQKILNQASITQEELASHMGIAQSTLANKLRLLNLTDEVQDALLKNKISERHARSLLSIKNSTKQVAMLERIINERLTVKQTDEEIAKMLEDGDDKGDSSVTYEPAEQVKSQNEFVPFDINKLLMKQDSVSSESTSDELSFKHDFGPEMLSSTQNETADQETSSKNPISFASLLNTDSNAIAKEFENYEKGNIEKDKEEEKPKAFEDITPNLDNIFSSTEYTDFSLQEAKPIIEEPTVELEEPENSTAPLNNEPEEYMPLGVSSESKTEEKEEIMETLEPEIIDLSDDTANNASEELKEEIANVREDDLKTAINKTRNFIDALKQTGRTVDSEEIDFNDEYQIIIKIKKENGD